jgi:hypothetical protein
MGWIPHLSPYYQMHVGSYDYIPSCQMPKATASRGLGAGNAYLLREALGHAWPGAQVFAQVNERGGRGRQVAKSCLPTIIIGWRRDVIDCSRG